MEKTKINAWLVIQAILAALASLFSTLKSDASKEADDNSPEE